MLPMYLLTLSLAILGPAPKAAAQAQYTTYIYNCFSTTNSKPRLTAITTADGETNLFRPAEDSQNIAFVYATFDFLYFERYKTQLQHLAALRPLPLFAVFDPNTTGLASDYVLGVNDDGTNKIVAVLSDNDVTKVYCQDCIRSGLTGYTSTSWDAVRKRWVSLADLSPGDYFAVSTDLMRWTANYWAAVNSVVGSFENILEMFPITDQDDPSKTVWVLIRNSKPDANTGLVTLLWDTFQPDDNDQQYKEMGVLDASAYINEYALVNDKSADYRTRRVLTSQRADYTAYGIRYNTFITGRELTYKGGRLRQMPISTVYGTPQFERFFPTINYHVGDTVLSCLGASSTFKIEAELGVVGPGSGFYFFFNPDNSDEYAASFVISGDRRGISLVRSKWFTPSPTPPPDTYSEIFNPFLSAISGSVKVLILVDVCIIDYFVQDGVYAGTIFVYPNLSWKHHEFFSKADTTVTNLKFTAIDSAD